MKAVLVVVCIFATSFAVPASGSMKEARTAIKAKDYVTAVKYLEPLAENGDTLAMLQLGLIFRTGAGEVTLDNARAFSYLLKAANEDEWKSQLLVAEMYNSGKGTLANVNQALKWASIAAGRGSNAARILAEKLRADMPIEDRKTVEAAVDSRYAATLIDGRPPDSYDVSCAKLRLQLDEVIDFMQAVKDEQQAKQLRSLSGGMRWSSLAMIYPSGNIARVDARNRGLGLLAVAEFQGCKFAQGG